MLSITPSTIIEYLYCERYIYFEYVLKIPQDEEKFSKVLIGRNIHDKKLKINKEYLRKKVGAVSKYINVYLTDDMLRGIVDEILIFNNNLSE
ncbi:MAG: CRISPR-associated protein Cas4, partial [Ignavibacteriaceae bacterium]|nr:CRISPR-associated protein Cas4 [Ignavibacteriaceae bacterium]